MPAAFYKTTQQVPTVEMIERYKKTGSPQGPNYEAYLGKNATPTSHAPFLKGTVRSQLDIQGCVCVCIVISGNPCVWAMKSKHSLDQALGSFGRRQRRRRNRNIFTNTRRLTKKNRKGRACILKEYSTGSCTGNDKEIRRQAPRRGRIIRLIWAKTQRLQVTL